ncbi:MAG: TIGR02646 family protein [Polyangiaceae bacterium]|nr:TIGR02646 family protein [Polyangiaceae bacterium]
MRKLNRSTVAEPPCLQNYRYGFHNWTHVDVLAKAQIRDHLDQMQGNRCAYCEGRLDELGQHIEHFRSRHRFPELTFAWANLFASCNQEDSCGHWKDQHERYDPDDLLDPCVDDPDEFFRFRSDGSIDIRKDLDERRRHRARTTLRVFNLDAHRGRLQLMRRRHLAGFAAMVADVHGLSPSELQQLLAAELVAAESGPFYTAVRHVLTQL